MQDLHYQETADKFKVLSNQFVEYKNDYLDKLKELSDKMMQNFDQHGTRLAKLEARTIATDNQVTNCKSLLETHGD